MHFAILDSEELLDAYGSSYVSYKIYVNGTFQGSARYREIYDLHESLKNELSHLPAFPPKKLFHLSAMEVNNRKQQLEKYLQNLGQMSEALSSAAFQDFLRKILIKSLGDLNSVERDSMKVYMLNENAVDVRVKSTVDCEELLECVGREIKLPADLTYFFGLYLAKEDQGRFTIFRKFAPCELPFAILNLNRPKSKPDSMRIVIKKAYWDPSFDTEILDSSSRVGTNLLFVETVDAINRNWITPSPEQKSQLESLQNKGSRREFVLLARTLPGYGSMHFRPCTIDYPTPGTSTKPFINGKDLVCPIKNGKHETVFKVTRMRCWRLCFSETYKNGGPADCPQSNLSIMFEYLMGKDQLQWISVLSEEAIWMSSCLQSIVEELLLKKRGLKYGKSGSVKRVNGTINGRTEESLSISVTITRKLTSDNSAFEEIGDDDL